MSENTIGLLYSVGTSWVETNLTGNGKPAAMGREPNKTHREETLEETLDEAQAALLKDAVEKLIEFNRLSNRRSTSSAPAYPDETTAVQGLQQDAEAVLASFQCRTDENREYELSDEMHEILERYLDVE